MIEVRCYVELKALQELRRGPLVRRATIFFNKALLVFSDRDKSWT